MSNFNLEGEQRRVRLDNLDLSRRDEATMVEWKDKIERNDGVVWVFVHPFYIEGKDYLPYQHKVNFKESVEGLFLVVRGGEPVVVFEEYLRDSLQNLEFKLALAGGGQILLVKTRVGDPAPCEIMMRGPREVVERVAWERLASLLQELAVKRIMIGGGFLGERDRWQDGKVVGREWSGCAGVAARELGKYFEVVFSRFTYPLVRDGGKIAGFVDRAGLEPATSTMP